MLHHLLELRRKMKEEAPLIHCITNQIAINDCANILLAVGAKPIMAEHPEEVAEITRVSGAFGANIGNITDVRMMSILRSVREAATFGIPWSVDAVGVSCSTLRRNYIKELITVASPRLVKGNSAEIRALCGAAFSSRGIDVIADDDWKATVRLAAEYAEKNHTVVLVTGPADLVTDGYRTCVLYNGVSRLRLVTGTGCMVHALSTAFLALGDAFHAAVLGAALMGICGEIADQAVGLGSFHMALFDAISELKDTDFMDRLRLETFLQ